MPNETSRPSDNRCRDDHGCVDCIPREPAPAGVCVHCGLGSCTLCGAPMTPAQCAASRVECPVPARNEVYCPVCLTQVCEGPEAVPVEVEEEKTRREVMTIETDGEGYLVEVIKVEAEAVA